MPCAAVFLDRRIRISSCLIVVGTVAGVRGTDVKQSAANRPDGYFRLDVSIVGEARSAKRPEGTTSAPKQGAGLQDWTPEGLLELQRRAVTGETPVVSLHRRNIHRSSEQ